ncbi:MAG TPA: J domain-containing protein [Alphaproteobacteria bacterium]|nr:J domain-containing protein [Alphaproteobacteria bacterium]
MPAMSSLEIQALAKIIDELDYYQILHLEPGSSASQVKRAFHDTSRAFHPDANRHLPPAVLDQCARIAKRVTEAYCVLRDPRRRKAYDDRLSRSEGLRMQLAEARAAHARDTVQERQGRTSQGRELYQKAMLAIQQEDWSSAAQNLQLALTFEADNAFFKEQLETVKERRKAARKKK